MSTLDSKLEQSAACPGGFAEATLKQLMQRWGSPRELDGKTAPEMVLVRQLDGTLEYWRTKRKEKTLLATVYELAEVTKAPESQRLKSAPTAGQRQRDPSPLVLASFDGRKP